MSEENTSKKLEDQEMAMVSGGNYTIDNQEIEKAIETIQQELDEAQDASQQSVQQALQAQEDAIKAALAALNQ